MRFYNASLKKSYTYYLHLSVLLYNSITDTETPNCLYNPNKNESRLPAIINSQSTITQVIYLLVREAAEGYPG